MAATHDPPVLHLTSDRPITTDDLAALEHELWPLYRKKVPIHAARVAGPFKVATSEGPLQCQDGWLCVDARGYPYPVARDEFELIYEDETPNGTPATTINDLRQTALDVLRQLANSNDPNVQHMAARTILDHTNNTGGTDGA